MSSSNQTLSSGAQVAPAPAKPIDTRRGRRIPLALPIKVFTDPSSLDFQACCTYEISLQGVRLVMPNGIKEVGQIVMLQRHNRRAKYKVAWIGKEGSAEAGQIGVETLEPHNVIWENELRVKLARPE